MLQTVHTVHLRHLSSPRARAGVSLLTFSPRPPPQLRAGGCVWSLLAVRCLLSHGRPQVPPSRPVTVTAHAYGYLVPPRDLIICHEHNYACIHSNHHHCHWRNVAGGWSALQLSRSGEEGVAPLLLCCSQQQQQQQSLETGAIVINAIIATASRADDCRVVQEGSLDIDIR